ncbi:MAG: FAD-dependent oxidoreductase [Candidatus Nitronauta litoralis]|uniref:FAD-dependent oxidoreductase n=1 Tax=Candidatus Nitronauta litoralis TaxID=2705533 RepID=A0A7T0BXB0_9BACT|nr:MAG: FAD-dependent oxidoreductase [Candidatus Nitronauta litoralis]
MDNQRFDIVIVGAGVIGHSIAFRLLRTEPGLKIAIVGDPVNSLMASRAAAGMLAPFCECYQPDRFFEFCRASLEKYPSFVQELQKVSEVKVPLSMAGSIMPYKSVEDQWDNRLAFFKDQNIPHEVWTAESVKSRLPFLAEGCGPVLWVEEGQINNRRLHDALMVASKNLGAAVINANVTGFVHDSTRIDRVVTDSGDIESERFVLASGSWSQQLAGVLGVSLPLKPIKGQMCRLRVEDSKLPYTVHGFLTYIAPWREGNGFVIGSTMEDDGFNPVVEEKVIQKLIEDAAEILPCLKTAPLIESWSGLRPAAEDQMPIMGKSARYSNLFYSTGHFRNGILQTPNQADYMAASILNTLKEPVPEFSPVRYGL